MIWVVRDSDEDTGAPMPYVSVWGDRPKRWAMGDGYVWLSPQLGDPLRNWLGSLFLPDARRLLGTLPDDDRQTLVLDRDPQRVQLAIAKANEFRVPRPTDG